jgi:hypothetical protein
MMHGLMAQKTNGIIEHTPFLLSKPATMLCLCGQMPYHTTGILQARNIITRFHSLWAGIGHGPRPFSYELSNNGQFLAFDAP